MKTYPRWLYSAAVPTGVIVRTLAEETALTGDWYDTPAKIPLPVELPLTPPLRFKPYMQPARKRPKGPKS